MRFAVQFVSSKFFTKFFSDERAAVTVDWVMLTSGVVLLGVLAVGAVQSALNNTSVEIAATIESAVST